MCESPLTAQRVCGIVNTEDRARLAAIVGDRKYLQTPGFR
jgi:hypothetical protein